MHRPPFLLIWCLLVGSTVSISALESREIRGVPVQRMSLTKNQMSPYCFAATSITNLNPTSNFLATQVWPSARFAAAAVKEHASSKWNVCEFGCGPGMPALTAASIGCNVIATDLDEFALELVQAAAEEQGWMVSTRKFDLIADSTDSKALSSIHQNREINLVIFSDVFENEHVARGAARVTRYFLEHGSRVWAFTQSDRAQRDAYVAALNSYYLDGANLAFSDNPYDPNQNLWLCDLDETKVVYG